VSIAWLQAIPQKGKIDDGEVENGRKKKEKKV